MRLSATYHHNQRAQTPRRRRDPTAPLLLRCVPPASWWLRDRGRKDTQIKRFTVRATQAQTHTCQHISGASGEQCVQIRLLGSTKRVSIRWGGYRMDTWEKEGAERRRKSGPLQEIQLGMELDWGKYGGCKFNQDLPIVTNGGGQVWKTSGGEQIKRDKNFPANGERKRWASTPSRTSLLAFFYIFNKAIVQIQITHPHMRNCSERVWNQWTWVQDESKGKESNKDIKKLSWDTSCFGLEEEKNGFSSWTAAGSREFADMCLPARCEPTASSQSRFTQSQKHTDTHTRFVTVQKCHWNQMPEKAPRGRPFAPLTQQLLHKWIRTNGCTDRKHMEVYWWTESLQQMKETDSSNNCHRSHLPLLFSH